MACHLNNGEVTTTWAQRQREQNHDICDTRITFSEELRTMVYRGEGRSSCQPPLSVRCDTKAAACPEQQHSSIDNDIICQIHERLPIGLRRSLTQLAATELLYAYPPNRLQLLSLTAAEANDNSLN